MQEPEQIREMLKRIACPACYGRLELAQEWVRCSACGRLYPVEDGIPVLLEARASRIV